jgi:hypothetical protein
MATDDVPLRRVRALTALVLLGTFLAGAILGAGLYRWLEPSLPIPPAPVFHMLGELDLSPQQQVQAQKIVERHEPELRAILAEGFPKLRAVHTEMTRELRTILTPAQRQKLDELERRRPPLGGFAPPGAGPKPLPELPPPPSVPK